MDGVLDLSKSLIFIRKKGLNWIKDHFFLGAKENSFWPYLMSDIIKSTNLNVHARVGGIRLSRSVASYIKECQPTKQIQYLNPNFVVNQNFKYEGNFREFKEADVYVRHLVHSTWLRRSSKKDTYDQS